MKKLFVSQPMKGKSEEEILQERAKAIAEAERLLGEPVEVLETYFEEGYKHPLEFLGKSIMYLAQADAAYFAPGWGVARGCKIEHTCAVEYGIPIVSEVPGND